jgi:hypothetical protein
MANLTESPIYEPGVFQLEKLTPPLGGAPVIDNGVPSAGHANAQALQLANRTNYLNQQVLLAKTEIDALKAQASLNSVNLSSFSGVDITGASDSTSGFQSALNSGAKVIHGRGVVKVTGTLSWPAGVVVDGGDDFVINFNLPAGTDGVVVVEPTVSAKYITGLINTRVTSASRGRYMFSTPSSSNAWSRQLYYDFTGLVSCDVSVGLTIPTNYWDRVLNIGDCRGLSLERFQMWGGWAAVDTDGTTHASRGIYISSTVGAIGINIRDGSFTSCSHPIEFSNGVEGHTVTDIECVSCWDGITYSNAGEEPGGFVDNVHINASHRGIVGSKRVEFQIGKISVYRSGAMAVHTAGWSAVDLSECNYKVTIGTIHGVPGSSTALVDSWALRLTNCAATFFRLKDMDLSLQMTGAILLDSVSGFRLDAISSRGMTTFCKILNTNFNTTDCKLRNVDTSNTDATLLDIPVGFNTSGIVIERVTGATNSPQTITLNSSSDTFVNPKAGLTTIALSGSGFTSNVVLSTVGASFGDVLEFIFVNSNTKGTTVNFCSGSAANVLSTFYTGKSNRLSLKFRYTGSAWVVLPFYENIEPIYRSTVTPPDQGVWTTLTLGSGVTATATTPQYRVLNDTVELRGKISITSAVAANTLLTFATMPIGFRPSYLNSTTDILQLPLINVTSGLLSVGQILSTGVASVKAPAGFTAGDIVDLTAFRFTRT